jgi:hypothetical protein
MSEEEKKHNGCCCCQSWKAIFIALTLLIIGAIFGHVMTMQQFRGPMRGPCGDRHGMKACWDRDGREREGGWEHKFRGGREACGEREGLSGHKDDTGKCQPGCTCPMCSKKAARLSEPNKAGCPMMDKKEGASEKTKF